jgi:hypothetical protein
MKFYLLLGPHACIFRQHPRLSVRSHGIRDHQDRSERGLQPMRRNALRRRATSVSEVVDTERNRRFGGFYGLEECML